MGAKLGAKGIREEVNKLCEVTQNDSKWEETLWI